MDYTKLASDESIQTTKKALEEHNIAVFITENGEEAKEKALSFIPEGAEVMTATSKTLEALGLNKIFNESVKYNSVKTKLMSMNRETDMLAMRKLGAAPEYIIGSAHAVTEDGKVLIASGSGSQLPGYSYGAAHVIWIVSTKKIVQNVDEATQRIYEHVLPLEDKRMKEVYGPQSGSNVNKLLIVNKELQPGRITLIFVKEDLGF